MADIVLNEVSKAYGQVQVLDSVSMHIKSGEFIVFLGPSGCGKSTLLRMIAGLEEVNAGQIHIGDTRVDQLPPNQRGVAMVFQNYALYPHMTVRENMSFGLQNVGTDKAEIARRVDDAARMLEITPLLDRRPSQLSGGQRQRVAIGRAIVREPKAFLLDEPLSNLDAGLRVRTRVELAQLHQRIGTTMIFVTHDQIEAMTLATRIVVMNNRRIEQIGTPMEVYSRPATRFVAAFVGSPAMNFLPVTAIAEVDGLARPQRLDAGHPARRAQGRTCRWQPRRRHRAGGAAWRSDAAACAAGRWWARGRRRQWQEHAGGWRAGFPRRRSQRNPPL
jgi:multiple sugar transport system ATP-binding protein